MLCIHAAIMGASLLVHRGWRASPAAVYLAPASVLARRQAALLPRRGSAGVEIHGAARTAAMHIGPTVRKAAVSVVHAADLASVGDSSAGYRRALVKNQLPAAIAPFPQRAAQAGAGGQGAAGMSQRAVGHECCIGGQLADLEIADAAGVERLRRQVGQGGRARPDMARAAEFDEFVGQQGRQPGAVGAHRLALQRRFQGLQLDRQVRGTWSGWFRHQMGNAPAPETFRLATLSLEKYLICPRPMA